MENKQTAVEWLEQELKKIPFIKPEDAFKQAKAMEEQQIIDIYHDAYKNGRKDNGIHGIEYYNQTFKKQSMSQESIDNQSDDVDELAKDVLYTKYPRHPWKDTGYWIDMFKEGYNKAKEKYNKYTDDTKAKTMKQQTAVEWLVEQIKLTYDKEHRLPIAYILSLTEEAKEMEKEQIEDAFQDGKWNGYEGAKDISEMKDPTEYYNETYGK